MSVFKSLPHFIEKLPLPVFVGRIEGKNFLELVEDKELPPLYRF